MHQCNWANKYKICIQRFRQFTDSRIPLYFSNAHNIEIPGSLAIRILYPFSPLPRLRLSPGMRTYSGLFFNMKSAAGLQARDSLLSPKVHKLLNVHEIREITIANLNLKMCISSSFYLTGTIPGTFTGCTQYTVQYSLPPGPKYQYQYNINSDKV